MPIKAKGSLANSIPRTEDEDQCHDDHPRFAAAYGRAPVSIPIPMRRCTNLGPCIESGGPLGPAVWLSRYCIFALTRYRQRGADREDAGAFSSASGVIMNGDTGRRPAAPSTESRSRILFYFT